MTDVFHGEDIAFDLYPKTDPRNGPRIRRLTSLQKGSKVRREQKGTGLVRIVVPGDSDDAAAIDPTLGHYIKAERKGALVNLVLSAAADDTVDTATPHGLVVGNKLEFVTLTGGAGLSTTPTYYVQAVPSATSLKVAATKGGPAIDFTTDITAGSVRKLTTTAGGFLLGGTYAALSKDGTKPLVLTGPGPLHILSRAVMAPHSYIGDDPQPEGVWPLHKQGPFFGDDHYGSMFARAMTEMKSTQADDPGDDPDSPHPNANDRLVDPIPEVTLTFDGFTDSNGVAWTGARGEFNVQVALEDGLRIAFRFMQAGLEIDLDPDTFELRAYNTGTLGSDRTGAAWGAGVVRYQVPTDDTVETANILTTAVRSVAAFIQRSLLWAGRENVWGVARNASAPVRWEGGYSADAADETSLDTIAGQQIVERTDAGDVPRLKVLTDTTPDESRGVYRYGPGGHADIWDRATVHSGTGTWDWNDWTAPISALEWVIENPNGEWDTYVEFGSTFRSINEVMQFAGGAVISNGPTIRFCDPATISNIATDTTWKALRLQHGNPTVIDSPEPDGWKEVGFDDSAWDGVVVSDYGFGYDVIWQEAALQVIRDEYLFRKEYIILEEDLEGADISFEWTLDNGGWIYINGVQVISDGTPYDPGGSNHVTTIARSYFRAGRNCIAVHSWNEDDASPGQSGVGMVIDLPTWSNMHGRNGQAERCGHGHLHSDLPGRSEPDAHPATAISYDNTTSGLGAGTVQGALDEVAERGAILAVTVAVSNPPTEAELETVLGAPAGVDGSAWVVTDGDTGLQYLALSDGHRYVVVPLIAQPASTSVRTLTAAPAGAWGTGTGTNQQVAQHYNGRTYFTYLKGTTGDLCVRYYDHASETVSAETVIAAAFDTDPGHASPVLLVREPDHRILVVYCDQADANLWVWTSTNPEDISGGSSVDIDSQVGGTKYTYPQIVQLEDAVNQPIYIFVETNVLASPTTQVWSYTKSTDGGATWSAKTDFFQEPTEYAYVVVSKTSGSRVDVLANDGAYTATGPFSLYHCWFEGDAFFESDGSAIAAALPFDASVMTQVYDGTADGVTTHPQHAVLGADGHPRIAFYAYYGGADHRVRWGRWTGSAWASVEVCDNGWDADDGRDTVIGAACLDRSNPGVLYTSRNVSGTNQIFRYTTPDDGVTFHEEQLTTGTPGNVRPTAVVDAAPDLEILWLHGESDPPPDFNAGIQGIGAQSAGHLTRLISIAGDKAGVEAMAGARSELLVAVATDTDEIGVFANGAWTWVGSSAASSTHWEPVIFDNAGTPEIVYFQDASGVWDIVMHEVAN